MSVALDPAPIPPDSGQRTSRWWLGAGAFVLLFFGLLLAGGEASDFAAAGFEAVPFAVLALLTYAGVRMPWARSLAWILLALLTTAVAALSVSATVDVVDTWVDGDATGWASLGLVCGGVVGGLLVGWSCCARRVRSALAGWLPIDPDSFVHQVALIAVISITIVSCVPVLVLGEPPLLASANDSGLEGSIRGDLYGLFWL